MLAGIFHSADYDKFLRSWLAYPQGTDADKNEAIIAFLIQASGVVIAQ
jgi:hypothetical protein